MNCNFAKVMMVDVVVTSETQAKQTALELCEKYGGGDLVLNDDPRLEELGITQAVQEKYTCHIWSPEQAEANITKSEQANIGIVYAEYGLTESGGIVLFSQAERGRSVSLLPEKSIVVVRKSKVLPRVHNWRKCYTTKRNRANVCLPVLISFPVQVPRQTLN